MAITLGQPYYDRTGKFRGVLATDLSIAQISNFLQSLKIGKTGHTFIFDSAGMLVATSSNEKPFKMVVTDPQRIHSRDSKNLMTRSATEYLEKHFGSLKNIKDKKTFNFEIDGKRHFMTVNLLQDKHGLNWTNTIIVPESDFMAEIKANTRKTILLCLASLLKATLLGMITSRWITNSIRRLSNASMAIANGDFAHNVNFRGIYELEVLADSYNQMARRLKLSFAQINHVNHIKDLYSNFKL